jgi:hypothetical protein
MAFQEQRRIGRRLAFTVAGHVQRARFATLFKPVTDADPLIIAAAQFDLLASRLMKNWSSTSGGSSDPPDCVGPGSF